MAAYSLIGEQLFGGKYSVQELCETFEISKDRLIVRLLQLKDGSYTPSARSLKDSRTEHPEYCIWRQLKERCLNPKDKEFHNYGGRGIKVQDEWLCPYFGFWIFLDHIGPRPTDSHSIDRIDNNSGYYIDNVRWVTSKEQSSNKRNNLIYKGKTMTQWSELTGIPYSTLAWRFKKQKNLGFNADDYSGRNHNSRDMS